MHEEDVSIVGCALSLESFFLSRPWSNCSATFPYNFREITLTALGKEKEIRPSTVRRYSYIGCGIRGGSFHGYEVVKDILFCGRCMLHSML